MIKPQEITSICASLAKAGLQSNKINGFLLKKIYGLNSSQLLSVIDYVSMLQSVKKDNPVKKSVLLLKVIEKFLKDDRNENELIIFFKYIIFIFKIN